MIDRRLVWTGTLNERALDPQPHRVVGLHDTTLWAGARSPGVSLGPEDTVEIARVLDAAGIDRIEIGLRPASEEDRRAVALVCGAGLRIGVWGASAADEDLVRALAASGVAGVTIEAPVSDRGLAAAGLSRETMLEEIRRGVAAAVAAGVEVAFAGIDASRTEPDQYRRAYDAAIEAGVREVVVADSAGIATPEAAAYLVGQTVDWLDGEIPVRWHGQDDFGLATAAAVAAVQAGAALVQGTVDGMGARAGSADLIEVALALEAGYGIPTRLDISQSRRVSLLVRERMGTVLPPWKAVTGDGVLTSDPGPLAPYGAALVGAD